MDKELKCPKCGSDKRVKSGFNRPLAKLTGLSKFKYPQPKKNVEKNVF